MKKLYAFMLGALLLSGCVQEELAPIENTKSVLTPPIVESYTASIESPKVFYNIKEESKTQPTLPALPLYILTPSRSYQLNYLTDFAILSLHSVETPIENGLASVIHDETLNSKIELLQNPSGVKVSTQGHKFTVSLADSVENEAKIVFLATEIDFRGCNSEEFVLYYQNNNQSKVYVNNSLVLTVDSMERVKSESSLQSLPFKLQSGRAVIMLKCLVDQNGTTGQLMLMPENASKQYKLEFKNL